MTDSILPVQLPLIETKKSVCLTELPCNEVDLQTDLDPVTTKSEIKQYYHHTKLLSKWYRKLNDYVDANLSNSTNNANMNNLKQSKSILPFNLTTTRKYSDLKQTVFGEQGRKRYTDIVSVERFKSDWAKRSIKSSDWDKSIQTSCRFQFTQIESALDDCNLGPFQNDMEDELQRRDFEEFILLQTVPTSRLGHLYFKILKLFRYIAVTNIEGTVITLLSLTKLVKRNAEVVQAVEECDGIVTLLNLLESGIVSVQLASMRLLISLCQILYLRRMAIAYGAVQLLVQLLVDPDDEIKLNAADLLATLVVLKEARLVMPQTPGVQHMVCLLNMTAQRIKKPKKLPRSIKPSGLQRLSLKIELEQHALVEETRNDRLLKAVATALWRLSHSLTNQHTMQKFGILSTLTHLVQSSNEQILIPVLGILHGCSTNPIFRVSIRHEGVLKYLIQHTHHRNLHVKLHSARTLFNCLDDPQTIDAIRILGGLKALVDLIALQTENASILLQSGWADSRQDSTYYKYKAYMDENNSAVTVNLGPDSSKLQEPVTKSRLHLIGTAPVMRPSNSVAGSSTLTGTTATDPSINGTSTMDGKMASGGAQTGRSGSPQFSLRSPVNTLAKRNLDSEQQTITFPLLHTLLATVWKTCVGKPNKECLVNLGLCDSLTLLLDILPPYLTIYYRTSNPLSNLLQKINLIEKVTSYALYCLGRLTELDKVRRLLTDLPDMLTKVVELLSHSSPDIVVPTIDVLTGIADSWDIFPNLNAKYGFIFVFSLQLNPNRSIQQAALKCVCKYLQKASLRNSLIKLISSSLIHLINLLDKYYNELTRLSKNNSAECEQTLAAICSTIAEVGSDSQGQAILSELGVSSFMVNLVAIANQECLRSAVCHAVTKFVQTPLMIQLFRDKQHLATLINYIRLGGEDLRLNATRALDLLSQDTFICDMIRTMEISSILLQIMQDGPNELHEAATHLIRRISLNEFNKTKHMSLF